MCLMSALEVEQIEGREKIISRLQTFLAEFQSD